MFPLHLQPESHVPLYIQLRDQIRALVHGGGGKQMIAALEFLKALQEFEDEEKNGTARSEASR